MGADRAVAARAEGADGSRRSVSTGRWWRGSCYRLPDRGARGGTCRRSSGLADGAEAATTDGQPMAPGTGAGRAAGRGRRRRRDRLAGVGGLLDHRRVHQHGATAEVRGSRATGSRSIAHRGRTGRNDKERGRRRDEPDDHAIGRSRGGLTTKTHAARRRRTAGRWCSFVTPGAGRGLTGPAAAAGPARGRSHRTGSAPHHPDRAAGGQGLLQPQAPRPAASPRHHRRHPGTRRPGRAPQAAEAPAAAGRSASTPSTTGTATSSNGSSTGSRTGAAWPPATTNTP